MLAAAIFSRHRTIPALDGDITFFSTTKQYPMPFFLAPCFLSTIATLAHFLVPSSFVSLFRFVILTTTLAGSLLTATFLLPSSIVKASSSS
jgi:hypothetical protein